MFSHHKSINVSEELAQLNDMVRMLVEIREEQDEINEEYYDEIWFDDMDQKVFSSEHKVHSLLNKGEKLGKSDQVSRCSPKSSAKSNSSSKSMSSTKSKAIAEKLKVAELMMEASFIKKKRDAEYQTLPLMMEEE